MEYQRRREGLVSVGEDENVEVPEDRHGYEPRRGTTSLRT